MLSSIFRLAQAPRQISTYRYTPQLIKQHRFQLKPCAQRRMFATENNNAADQQQSPQEPTPPPLLPPLPPSPAQAIPAQHKYLVQSMQYYYNALRNLTHELDEKRVRGYSLLRISAISIAALLLLGYVFRENIKHFFSQHGADVASQALNSQPVAQSAEQLAKAVVDQVLSDPATVTAAVKFLQELSQRPETQEMIIQLLLKVLQDPNTQAQASQLLKYLFSRPEVQQSLLDLVNHLSQQESFRESVNALGANLVKSDMVFDAFKDLGIRSVHQILDDESVRQHSIRFVQGVLNDPSIQSDASQALWEVLKGTISPWGTKGTVIIAEKSAAQPTKATQSQLSAAHIQVTAIAAKAAIQPDIVSHAITVKAADKAKADASATQSIMNK